MGVGISSMAKISGTIAGAASALALTTNKDKERTKDEEKEINMEQVKEAATKNKITQEYLQESNNKNIALQAEANRISIEHVKAKVHQQGEFAKRLGAVGTANTGGAE